MLSNDGIKNMMSKRISCFYTIQKLDLNLILYQKNYYQKLDCSNKRLYCNKKMFINLNQQAVKKVTCDSAVYFLTQFNFLTCTFTNIKIIYLIKIRI